MQYTMRKPRDLSFKIFTAQLKELNNYLPLLPGLIYSNKMYPKELNVIIFYTVPNGWTKQAFV